MTVELVDKILDCYPSIRKVNFCGYGETLLGRNFPAIVNHLLDRGKNVIVITNGIRVLRMKYKIPWSKITTRISLNEVTRATYKESTGVDRFHDVVNALKWLRSIGANVRVSFKVSCQDIERARDYIAFASRYPGLSIALVPISDYTDGKDFETWSKHAFFCDDAHSHLFFDSCRKFASDRRVEVASWPISVPRSGPPAPGATCQWPFRNIVVDGSGNVTTCCRPSDESQNICDVGEKAWYSPELEALRDGVAKGGEHMPKMCWQCIAKEY